MKYLLYSLFSLIIILFLYGCSSEEEDEGDIVQISPPPQSELQTGRIFSDEKIYINGDGTGNFRTHCKESHISNDDPLVHPGQSGAAHQHVFFGFRKTDANTTINMLENTKEPSTCEGIALNQSAYWVQLFSQLTELELNTKKSYSITRVATTCLVMSSKHHQKDLS